MKRLLLAVATLVAGGVASAAMFAPLPSAEPPRAKPTKMSAPAQPTAAAVADTGRQPVPFARLPPPPAPEMATLTEPPADLSQIQPKPPTSDAETAKMVADRGLTNDGRCSGRTLTSVRVEPDGTVHVQC